jgi:hypothetical protein
LVIYPAALELPHALVEWVTMLIVTREGDRRCKLRPSQRAIITLVYLREHTTYAKLAAGFRISEGTAHAYVQRLIGLLASKAPSLTQALRRARPEYVLVDGTIAECDRFGDHERDYSGKARRHGVNIQAVPGVRRSAKPAPNRRRAPAARGRGVGPVPLRGRGEAAPQLRRSPVHRCGCPAGCRPTPQLPGLSRPRRSHLLLQTTRPPPNRTRSYIPHGRSFRQDAACSVAETSIHAFGQVPGSLQLIHQTVAPV